MDANGPKNLHEFKFPSKTAIVFGSETNGIKNLVFKNVMKLSK